MRNDDSQRLCLQRAPGLPKETLSNFDKRDHRGEWGRSRNRCGIIFVRKRRDFVIVHREVVAVIVAIRKSAQHKRREKRYQRHKGEADAEIDIKAAQLRVMRRAVLEHIGDREHGRRDQQQHREEIHHLLAKQQRTHARRHGVHR